MRVLLISPNIEMLPDPVAPLGLAFLSSALKSAGHEVRCLDLCFEENIEQALEKAVSGFSPEAIGLSLRNIDNVAYPESVSYLPFFKKVVERCRLFSSSPVFLGGSGFTLMPEAILNFLEADGGIAGEGEEAFPRVLGGLPRFPLFIGHGFHLQGGKRLWGPCLHSKFGFPSLAGLELPGLEKLFC